MSFPAARPPVSSFSLLAWAWPGGWRHRGLGLALLALAGSVAAADSSGEFGKDVQLAPFVVQGKPLSIAIHARTKGDRRYGEKFADEVVEVACETLGDSTGKGLVIVGAKGEPHPILLFRKVVAASKAGRLDPSLAPAAAQLEETLGRWEAKFKIDDREATNMGITFDTFLPAFPMPLEGAASRLYQIAWAEGFDDVRVEGRLATLRLADLERDELARYDWVFYVPPHAATGPVLKELMEKAMRAERMGFFKRAAIKGAVLAFRPFINKAVEAMRSGFLFQAILRAQGPYGEDDLEQLTRVYVRELMPDLKPGSGDEKRRALAAIEKQKIANAEYAKDPFVPPARLEAYDPAAYAACLGDYTDDATNVTHRFTREGDAYHWNYKTEKPRVFYPAGERLLVNEAGTMTIRFLIDEAGAVTGVEERWVRRRKTVSRKT